jgi:hypothetical protein
MRDIYMTISTSAGGAATVSGGTPVGYLYAVRWNQGTLAATTDATFAYVNPDGDTITVFALTNVSTDAVYLPRVQCVDAAGAAITGQYAPPIIAGPLTLTIAQGGATAAGNCILYLVDLPYASS